MTVYIAILQDEKRTVVIEFVPLLDNPEFEPFFDGIEIVSVDIEQRPHTWQELKAAHQRTPLERKPRQLGMFRDTLREP